MTTPPVVKMTTDPDFPQTFHECVCMYINDTLQYLRAATTGKPVDIMRDEFGPTLDENRIVNGLQRVKAEAMKAARVRPLEKGEQ